MIWNIFLEGITCCFMVLMCCVAGIANGPVNMVYFYEEEVQKRAVDLGLTSRKKIAEGKKRFVIFGILPYFIFVILAVYLINGARGFRDGFMQMTALLLIEGFFDRIFIDWYWVTKTRAWIIEGTEDLMPYIYGRTLIGKWAATLIGYPLMAAAISYLMTFICK